MLPFTALQLSELEKSLRQDCTEQVIKRGWNDYNDQYVKKIEVSDHHTILGYVAEEEAYAVTIDVETFMYSHCSCNDDQRCKHIIAVYFQFLKKYMQMTTEQIKQSYFRLLGLQPASQLVTVSTNSITKEQLTEEQVEEWIIWLNQTYGEAWRGCRHSLHPMQSILTNVKAIARDWQLSAQQMYWCYAIIFVLQQSERAIASIDSFSRYYYETTLSRMSEPWLAQFHDLLEEFKKNVTSFDSEGGWQGWAEALMSELRNRALHKERSFIEWDYMYIAVAQSLGQHPTLVEQEHSKLLMKMDHPSRTMWNEDFLKMAIAYQLFLQHHYEQSLQYLSDANFDRVQKLMYSCIQELVDNKEQQHVLLWLQSVYKQLKSSAGRRTVGPFIRLCLAAEQAFPHALHFESYMLGLLPHSYMELSEYLIMTERYLAWTELQLYTGVKLEEMNSEQVRKVSKYAPQQLLPLYHQSIDASITARTRQGYRIAAKQLKALEKLYEQQAKMEKFQQYIYFIAEKHKRLRAFQEELWKGNLIK